MAHSRAWSDSTPLIGDNLADGYSEINNLSQDVNERMALEHIWDTSQTYDGIHQPGLVAAVENLGTAATIIANAGDFGDAYNGSIAMASDTKVIYVKVGTENQTNGTWTATTVGFSPTAVIGSTVSTTLPNGLIMKWGETANVQGGTFTFPAAFPTTCFFAVLNQNVNSGLGKFTARVKTKSKTQFTFTWGEVYISGANCTWFALGF